MSYNRPQADNTNGERWTKEDENRLLKLGDDDNYTIPDIADEFEGRSQQAIKNKLRKLRKREGTYNSAYQDEKYQVNREWISQIADHLGPALRVFDGYAGVGNSTKIYLSHADYIEACEIERTKYEKMAENITQTNALKFNVTGQSASEHEYRTIGFNNGSRIRLVNENVNMVLHRKIGHKEAPYNFVDLDPCGSPFASVPQAIKLINDGYLAVTYGDVQLHRWGRTAPLTKAYRMPEVDSFKEVVAYMVGWTLFEGVRQENSELTRKISVEDFRVFDHVQHGVIRVLYRVKKIGKLADVMNHLEQQLGDFSSNRGPDGAKYDFSEEEIRVLRRD